MTDTLKETDDQTARRERTVPGGRYTNHVAESLAEDQRKVAVYDLQRERSDYYVELMDAVNHEAKRQILTTIYFHDGVCMYSDLNGWVNRHISNIKKHVATMDSIDLVNRSGNPAVVSFPDTDAALLVEDVLNLTD